MTEPRVVKQPGRIIAGIQIRTSNELEMRSDDARIPRLWQSFESEKLNEVIPDKAAGSPVYGVYTEYSNGMDGEYSVLAGVEVTDEAKVPDDYLTAVLNAGDYLAFEAQGPLDRIVPETWARVWAYFESAQAPQRAFDTDYEVYESTDKVTLYVGIR
ncbi:transcription activator, effector binding domain-containing protein [Alcanivorax xiamenensis]|uniref:Transcription activator, effector binding domain-containing protein n=1 Tax=Alcanivorax xiamenensis TaxID=1177156 RepID=A0ABQ6Y4Q4_9GAMM|nr:MULTISPECIES: GyrI-like domain-containing protein [Alcanivorax]KAF0804194.1 transcription activator, effector binding domain-containing protein [Alcanivorax xiamenensis]